MNCLANEQLVELALADAAGADRESERNHVAACARCAGRLKEMAEQLGRVESAMIFFDRDHAAERKRLLAALAAAGKRSAKRSLVPAFKEIMTMPRTWIGSAVAAALIVGAILLWQSAGTPTLLAQAVQALREVKSLRCQVTTEATEDGKKDIDTMTWRWTPSGMRFDTHLNGKLVFVEIYARDKPGLEIDHRAETYQRIEPFRGPVSPIMVFSKLADFAGQADRKLDARSIKGIGAPGFEIALDKIDPDLGEGTVRLWIDPKTRLPLRVEMTKMPHFMVWENFEWNVPTTDWFTLEPPAKYLDKTPTPPGVDEITQQIVLAFTTYAKYSNGKYSQAKLIYGDVTSGELNVNAGLPPRSPPDLDDKKLWEIYRECSAASRGFGQINQLQRHDAGAVYHGKNVGPMDKNKVLFRWTLVDGRFRVIYGDLRVEDVSATRVKTLEKRNGE